MAKLTKFNVFWRLHIRVLGGLLKRSGEVLEFWRHLWVLGLYSSFQETPKRERNDKSRGFKGPQGGRGEFRPANQGASRAGLGGG